MDLNPKIRLFFNYLDSK